MMGGQVANLSIADKNRYTLGGNAFTCIPFFPYTYSLLPRATCLCMVRKGQCAIPPHKVSKELAIGKPKLQ